MEFLALFLVTALIGAASLALVISWSTHHAANSAITRYFRASEYILETGKPPPDWLSPPRWKRLLPLPNAHKRDRDLLSRLDDLIRFFEQCSFFEDEWTRQQLLAQLDAVREKWELAAAA